MQLADKIKEAVAAVNEACDGKLKRRAPEVAIILGTGLGKLVEQVSNRADVPYEQIPHFPAPTVATHAGRLVIGDLSGKRIVALDGRFHYYEGYSLEQVTFPVRVARALGAITLIVSNAAGGMNPMFEEGDIVLIEDHVNLMGVNPLIGPNDDSLGQRFPDMCEPYDHDLIRLAEKTALALNVPVKKGVYVAVTGPNLETRAEYRFLRGIGCDLVGMSTVPEVLVAVHGGMRILGLSVVTDRCLPDALRPADIKRIIKTANAAEPKLTALVSELVKRI